MKRAKSVASSVKRSYQPKPQQPGKAYKTPLIKQQRKHKKP